MLTKSPFENGWVFFLLITVFHTLLNILGLSPVLYSLNGNGGGGGEARMALVPSKRRVLRASHSISKRVLSIVRIMFIWLAAAVDCKVKKYTKRCKELNQLNGLSKLFLNG